MEWPPEWLAGAAHRQRHLWRGVEAQHRVATMRLADNLDEQLLLEQLLESSKPVLPPEARGLHYLLFTPFRYVSPWGSRFRRPHEAGAWYGAEEPATVAAEVAHWRWKFFMDSDGLRAEQLVTEHTFFQARFDGSELDLTEPPWNQKRDAWRQPDDYTACQQLASEVRQLQPPVQAIRYESARRAGGRCQVVFAPQALAMPQVPRQQTWICKTTRALVLLSHDDQSFQFDMPAPPG
jgi:hypothetical protein